MLLPLVVVSHTHATSRLVRLFQIAGDVVSAEKNAATLSRLRGGEPWAVVKPPEWVLSVSFHSESYGSRLAGGYPPPHTHTHTHTLTPITPPLVIALLFFDSSLFPLQFQG